MELISTDEHFIFHKIQQCEHALWICRLTGTFSIRASWDLASESNPECLGAVWGLVGKLKIHPNLDDQLVVIRECEKIADLPDPSHPGLNYPVYRVKSVALLPISPSPPVIEPPLKSCPKHHVGVIDPGGGFYVGGEGGHHSRFPFKVLGGKFTQVKDSLKSTAGSAATGIAAQVKVPWKKKEVGNDLERVEKRLLEEFSKMFNDSRSFYFSYTGDLTTCLQKQYECQQHNRGLAVWRRADERFFFNKALLAEMLELADTRIDAWILPLVQGFIELKECVLELEEMQVLGESKLPSYYRLCLISRRARARAGTRYKRRGVDEEGKVANYVETEQILLYHTYSLSFLQTRGSIPVFWSQPGIKYRPPPRIDRSLQENKEAFTKHFQEQLDLYGPVNCISLVERNGREKILSDVFVENILTLNQPDVSFISFDFHEYCRGMKFENVSILLESVHEILMRTGYFWLDTHGQVCDQKGVFRINCVDCLDRTNVVQTAIGRSVLELQLTKLGVVQPEHGLSLGCKKNFQSLWANNGDMISRQYAGTNALKGDYTRTGERNLSGLVKDGVNSASRYYLNHIRDTYRQAAIDLLIGEGLSEEVFKTEANEKELDVVDGASTAVHVKTVIEDCRKLLTQDYDRVIGAWGLIDADIVTGDPAQEDLDIVFILTDSSYYVARYDDQLDKITDYQQVALADIVKIEFGVPEHTFNISFLNKTDIHCFRLQYKVGEEFGYHHMFRSTNLRFFNNVATEIKGEDEKVESLKAIADSVAVAVETCGYVPDMWFGKLDKRRSKQAVSVNMLNPVDLLNLQSGRGKSPVKLRNVGSKALSNVTSTFSKLNPISRLRRQKDFTDIRNENDTVDGSVEVSEGPFSSPLHLPSSGLLMNLDEGQTSISCSKSHSSQTPAIRITQDTSLASSLSSLKEKRTRKVSRSTEDLFPKALESNSLEVMLIANPINKLARSLQSIGDNIDVALQSESIGVKLSESQASSCGVHPGAGIGTQRPNTSPNPFSHEVQKKIEASSCKSLILTI